MSTYIITTQNKDSGLYTQYTYNSTTEMRPYIPENEEVLGEAFTVVHDSKKISPKFYRLVKEDAIKKRNKDKIMAIPTHYTVTNDTLTEASDKGKLYAGGIERQYNYAYSPSINFASDAKSPFGEDVRAITGEKDLIETKKNSLSSLERRLHASIEQRKEWTEYDTNGNFKKQDPKSMIENARKYIHNDYEYDEFMSSIKRMKSKSKNEDDELDID